METKIPSAGTDVRVPRFHASVTIASGKGARDHQEDACGHWSGAGSVFAVVADGAGGHGGGADAARAVIASAAEAWDKNACGGLAAPAEFLAAWMADAHRAVNEAASRIRRSARAVVVACMTDGRAAHWVHAGDSRLLRFREGRLMERTRDDSVVQVLFERGDITEAEMGTHPDQGRLLQSLGGEDLPSPRPGNAELLAGDVLILCSDGFWEHLRRDELEDLAALPPARRERALDKAVAEAVRRGGDKADNVTVVMIAFDEGQAESGSGIPRVLLLLFVALAGCAAALWWGKGSESGGPSWWRHLREIIGRDSPVRDGASKEPRAAPPAPKKQADRQDDQVPVSPVPRPADPVTSPDPARR